jgi:hypothetical protein
MPVRLKWFKASSLNKEKLNQILAGLIENEYSEKKRWGFSNVVLRGVFIEGQYIERIESVVKLEDPFGKPVQFSRIDFENFTFAISTKFPHIEIQDAPRGLGAFFNQIAGYLNFTVGIESINVNLANWIKLLESEAESVQVLGAIASSISLSNSIQARIVVSGSTEVRPSIKKLTGKYSYALNKMQVSGIYRAQSFKCDLFSDGRANILAGTETEIASILKTSLITAVENAPK